MKKVNVAAALALVVMLAFSAPVLAQVDFFIDAQLNASSSATFGVSRVLVGPPETFIPQAPGFVNLSFGTLQLNANGIFIPQPPFYWAVDIGSNGAGMPDIDFTYTDTANPNGPINNGSGLGGHATIAYAEIVTNPNGTQTSNLIRVEGLADSNTSGGIDETDYADGFLRLSVGIATDDATSSSPFTSLDTPGPYSGRLTITATFD